LSRAFGAFGEQDLAKDWQKKSRLAAASDLVGAGHKSQFGPRQNFIALRWLPRAPACAGWLWLPPQNGPKPRLQQSVKTPTPRLQVKPQKLYIGAPSRIPR
jgi:hypothetical protein